eukprot:scaffold95889_cov38-Tisochrysis_lutea.AAC.1
MASFVAAAQPYEYRLSRRMGGCGRRVALGVWVLTLAHCTALTPPLRSPASRLRALEVAGEAVELYWFVKTESFCKPFPAVKPHLEAHRAWVAAQRSAGYPVTSGYRVDEEGRPGGGGLMLFRAVSHEAALEFVSHDPLVANGCVDYQVNQWIAEVGNIALL